MIYVNGEKTVLPSNHNPNVQYNVKVFTSNNWDPAADVQIKELSIDREDDSEKLTEWKKVYSQVDRSYNNKWEDSQCSVSDCDEVYDDQAANKNFMRLGHIIDQTRSLNNSRKFDRRL